VEALDARVAAHSEAGGLYKAHARYLLPHLLLPSPLFFSLDMRSVCTQRAYEAKLPALSKRSISLVSSGWSYRTRRRASDSNQTRRSGASIQTSIKLECL
jgi:hypothetical protein